VLGAAPESRSDYGRALIKSAAAGMPGAAACALGPATELKRRITMIALSTRSRARRLAGTAIATILVGLGLGLTASGSIAAPSKIAPESVKPLFHVQPQARLIMVADNGKTVTRTTTTTSGDDDAAIAPPPPATPSRIVPPAAPVAPVAMASPVPPVAPVPPVGAKNILSAEEIAQINAQVSQAAEQAKQAGEMARQAVASIDFAKLNHEAMLEARTELERECKHAKPPVPGESDAQAIQRLSMGCVDMAAIGREVQTELAKAMEEVRADQHMSQAERAKALATIDRTRAEMAKKFAQ
jgi:hypothetical protein